MRRGWGRRGDEIPGPVPGKKYGPYAPPPGTTEQHDQITDRNSVWQFAERMGHIKTTPTPGQLMALQMQRGVQGGGAELEDGWLGMVPEHYEALTRKMRHLFEMPGPSAEFNPYMLQRGQQAHMPPAHLRPDLPPIGGNGAFGEGFEAADHSWQELLDELQTRRVLRALQNARMAGIRTGGLGAGIGDDAMLGA